MTLLTRRLSLDIYTDDGLRDAAVDFADRCTLLVTRDDRHAEVRLTLPQNLPNADARRLLAEFLNKALIASLEQRLDASRTCR